MKIDKLMIGQIFTFTKLNPYIIFVLIDTVIIAIFVILILWLYNSLEKSPKLAVTIEIHMYYNTHLWNKKII